MKSFLLILWDAGECFAGAPGWPFKERSPGVALGSFNVLPNFAQAHSGFVNVKNISLHRRDFRGELSPRRVNIFRVNLVHESSGRAANKMNVIFRPLLIIQLDLRFLRPSRFLP